MSKFNVYVNDALWADEVDVVDVADAVNRAGATVASERLGFFVDPRGPEVTAVPPGQHVAGEYEVTVKPTRKVQRELGDIVDTEVIATEVVTITVKVSERPTRKLQLLPIFDKLIERVSVPGNWIQGEFGEGTGPQCLVGHIRTVTHWNSVDRLWDAAYYKVRDAVRAVTGRSTNIPMWNDYVGRTQEEVIAAAKAAKEYAEKNDITEVEV